MYSSVISTHYYLNWFPRHAGSITDSHCTCKAGERFGQCKRGGHVATWIEETEKCQAGRYGETRKWRTHTERSWTNATQWAFLATVDTRQLTGSELVFHPDKIVLYEHILALSPLCLQGTICSAKAKVHKHKRYLGVYTPLCEFLWSINYPTV